MTTGSRTEGLKGIGAEGFIRTVKNLTVTGDLVVHGETRSTVGTGHDVSAFWETADANANYWAYDLPAGGATAVPVMGIGIGLKDVDLGLFNGLTQPTLAVLDADRDSYLVLDFSADDSPRIRSNQDLTFSGNVVFSDNITVNGTTTTVSSSVVTIDDPLFHLANDNPANSVDLGIIAEYTDSGKKFAGLFRDASDSNKWKLFATTGNSHEEPSTTVNTTSGFTLGNLAVNELEGTLTTASQTNITAVGTIATGTWEGTTIAVDQGGTGATSLNNLITLTTHTTGNYVATITGGTGIDSDAATSGEGTTHTLSIDLAEVGEVAIADGDYIAFMDATDSNATKKEALADVATLFSGTGLTAASSVINVDAAQSGITSLGTLTGLALGGNKSVTPGDGAMIHLDSGTITDSNTSGSGTAALYTHVRIEPPTLAATNSSVTTTTAATLYVAGLASAGSNQTITNNYGVWIFQSAVRAAHANGSALVIENDGNVGLTLLGGNGSNVAIYFGDDGGVDRGLIQYAQDDTRFEIRIEGNNQLFWSAGAFAFQVATTISTSTGALTLSPSSGSLLFTGTLALTGSRVTQSYHTNLTSTNAVTVDSWSASKDNIAPYNGHALDILHGVDVISFRHLLDRDPSGRIKLGVRAESIQEPMALVNMDYGHGLGDGPALDTMGLLALAVKAIQELRAEVAELKET